MVTERHSSVHCVAPCTYQVMAAVFAKVGVEQLLFGQHLEETLQKGHFHTLGVGGPYCLLQLLVVEVGVQVEPDLSQKNSEDEIV